MECTNMNVVIGVFGVCPFQLGIIKLKSAIGRHEDGLNGRYVGANDVC
jgi:hypothetical protein